MNSLFAITLDGIPQSATVSNTPDYPTAKLAELKALKLLDAKLEVTEYIPVLKGDSLPAVRSDLNQTSGELRQELEVLRSQVSDELARAYRTIADLKVSLAQSDRERLDLILKADNAQKMATDMQALIVSRIQQFGQPPEAIPALHPGRQVWEQAMSRAVEIAADVGVPKVTP